MTNPFAARARTRVPPDVTAALLGIACAVVGGVARLPLGAALGDELAFVTFYPAVTVAAWAGGLIGGLAAVAMSLVLVEVVVAPVPDAANLVGVAVFVVAGALIAALGGQLRRSRSAALTSAERAGFVAEASKTLAEQIDREVALDTLANAVVPVFADWCAIDLFDEHLAFEGAVIVGPDARRTALAHQLRVDYPYPPDAPAGVAWVARTGLPEYALRIPDDFFAQIPDDRLRTLMDGLGLRSYISVPMQLPGGRTIGVLSVVMSDSGREFTLADVGLAGDLARRAAVAIDHADVLRAASARRDELQAVIGAINDGILLADEHGNVIVQNGAAARMLGEAVGTPLDDVLAGLAPVPGDGDLRLTRSGRYVLPRILRAGPGAAAARFAMLEDRTDVVETEAARDTFVSMLSHELRTPITTIYGGAQLLRRDPPEATRRELLEEVGAETDRLYQLVEDLLVLSRYERGRLDAALEPVLIGHVLTDAVRAEAAQHPRLRVDLTVEQGLPTVLADPTYLRQIVRNLVSNAAKYAGDHPHLTVRATAAAGIVRLEFEDDGPGVTPEAAATIFELFERLPSDRMKPGAGIGLFVCRQLAALMGGRMTVETSTDRGACFVVELPVAPEDDDVIPSGAPRTGVPAATGRHAALPERPS
jgi:signal transduction histidine kinase